MDMNSKLDDFKSKVPYPPVKVDKKNSTYADLILINYAGMVSEFTAVAQYVNHEIRLAATYPEVHESLEKIAQVEMIHLQILGELIVQLGGDPGYWIHKGGKKRNWNPDFIDYGSDLTSMLKLDLEAEESAIRQYRETAARIKDKNIVDIINRIILDEELHIEILAGLLAKYS